MTTRYAAALILCALMMPALARAQSPPPISGKYTSSADSQATITVDWIRGGGAMIRHVRSIAWEAVGFVYEGGFRGVLLPHPKDPAMRWKETPGSLVLTLEPDGRVQARAEYSDGKPAFEDVWTPVKATSRGPAAGVAPAAAAGAAKSSDELPAFGDYVYVEELPEAITKVGPIYPDAARKDGIEGKVVIQALVLKDGSVGETRVQLSIPGLDEAARQSVSQWKFKPARTAGKPIAVWVAVPVSFKLH